MSKLDSIQGTQTNHSSCHEVGKGSVTVIIACIHQILWTVITEDTLLKSNYLLTIYLHYHTELTKGHHTAITGGYHTSITCSPDLKPNRLLGGESTQCTPLGYFL